MEFPEGILYTKDHEWVRIDGNIATVGITEYASSELGDIVYIEIESIGEELNAEEAFGSIEAVKTVSDLFMPLKGKVLEFNSALEDEPGIANSDPYGEGWIIKMEVAVGIDTSNLLSATTYSSSI